VYFKALDDAGFSAVNSLVEDVFVLTASFGIHLLRPVSSGDMKAIGKVVQASKNLFVAEATHTNSEGEELAPGNRHMSRKQSHLIAGHRL
jgi:acyl-coenzyme A thioesterase PaaI-like protein